MLLSSSRCSSVAMIERDVLLKLRYLTAKLHGVTADQRVMFVVTVPSELAVTTSV